MKESQPLVSCICLTHNSVDLLQRSIKCFQEQTYRNKELVVAFTDDNQSAAALINRLGDASVKPLVYASEPKMTLGEKRNAAIRHANGQYICNWDDDDWHHMQRIETQATELFGTGNKASILSQLILYDGASRDSYISAARWGWEQTLFCEKSLFDNPDWQYQHADRGEDSPLIYKLKQSNLLVSIPRPDLYIYVYHSRNVCHREHWEVNLLPWAEKMVPDRAAVVLAMLDEDGGDKNSGQGAGNTE